jgi:hypothetical protein
LVNTNDPLEFLDYCHVVSSNGDAEKSEVRRQLDMGHEINNIIKRKFKICCFCKDSKITGEIWDNNPILYKGYCRSRMWSQYAENQKGVCLIFNRKGLIDIIRSISDLKSFEKEIVYDDNLSGLFSAYDIEYSENINKTALERSIEYIDNYLFMKLNDYSHEQEYRIALFSDKYNEGDCEKINFGDSLEGIIIGPRFNKNYIPSIRSSLGNISIPIFVLNWFNGKPEIDQIK